jgi:hypothetical protein
MTKIGIMTYKCGEKWQTQLPDVTLRFSGGYSDRHQLNTRIYTPDPDGDFVLMHNGKSIRCRVEYRMDHPHGAARSGGRHKRKR